MTVSQDSIIHGCHWYKASPSFR